MIQIRKEWGFLAAALIALSAAAAASQPLAIWFDRLLFGLSPWLVIAATAAIGFVCLRWLDTRGWRAADRVGQGVLAAAILALAFGAIVILADLTLGFPADINAPWPWSLLFYIAMAFIAEVIFHLAPLALAATAARAFSWRIIVLAALPEAVFQASQAPSLVLQAFVAAHVFAYGAAALFIFRRYGFLAMLVMRLSYYALWHVVWGYARLHW